MKASKSTDPITVMLNKMDGIETVSYTHLDVYKRQIE